MTFALIALGWVGTGLLGSWLVVWGVGGVHPWLDLRFWSPFSLLVALAGPCNLFAGIVYAVIFRWPATGRNER